MKIKLKQITIKTPPISVNQLYKGRKFLTREGKDTKLAMAWEAKAQLLKNVIDNGDIRLKIIFYFKDNRRDIDGSLKGLLDCLSGVWWKDDRQIKEIHCFKEIDKQNPRIEIYEIPS